MAVSGVTRIDALLREKTISAALECMHQSEELVQREGFAIREAVGASYAEVLDSSKALLQIGERFSSIASCAEALKRLQLSLHGAAHQLQHDGTPSTNLAGVVEHDSSSMVVLYEFLSLPKLVFENLSRSQFQAALERLLFEAPERLKLLSRLCADNSSQVINKLSSATVLALTQRQRSYLKYHRLLHRLLSCALSAISSPGTSTFQPSAAGAEAGLTDRHLLGGTSPDVTQTVEALAVVAVLLPLKNDLVLFLKSFFHYRLNLLETLVQKLSSQTDDHSEISEILRDIVCAFDSTCVTARYGLLDSLGHPCHESLSSRSTAVPSVQRLVRKTLERASELPTDSCDNGLSSQCFACSGARDAVNSSAAAAAAVASNGFTSAGNGTPLLHAYADCAAPAAVWKGKKNEAFLELTEGNKGPAMEEFARFSRSAILQILRGCNNYVSRELSKKMAFQSELTSIWSKALHGLLHARWLVRAHYITAEAEAADFDNTVSAALEGNVEGVLWKLWRWTIAMRRSMAPLSIGVHLGEEQSLTVASPDDERRLDASGVSLSFVEDPLAAVVSTVYRAAEELAFADLLGNVNLAIAQLLLKTGRTRKAVENESHDGSGDLQSRHHHHDYGEGHRYASGRLCRSLESAVARVLKTSLESLTSPCSYAIVWHSFEVRSDPQTCGTFERLQLLCSKPTLGVDDARAAMDCMTELTSKLRRRAAASLVYHLSIAFLRALNESLSEAVAHEQKSESFLQGASTTELAVVALEAIGLYEVLEKQRVRPTGRDGDETTAETVLEQLSELALSRNGVFPDSLRLSLICEDPPLEKTSAIIPLLLQFAFLSAAEKTSQDIKNGQDLPSHLEAITENAKLLWTESLTNCLHRYLLSHFDVLAKKTALLHPRCQTGGGTFLLSSFASDALAESTPAVESPFETEATRTAASVSVSFMAGTGAFWDVKQVTALPVQEEKNAEGTLEGGAIDPNGKEDGDDQADKSEMLTESSEVLKAEDLCLETGTLGRLRLLRILQPSSCSAALLAYLRKVALWVASVLTLGEVLQGRIKVLPYLVSPVEALVSDHLTRAYSPVIDALSDDNFDFAEPLLAVQILFDLAFANRALQCILSDSGSQASARPSSLTALMARLRQRIDQDPVDAVTYSEAAIGHYVDDFVRRVQLLISPSGTAPLFQSISSRAPFSRSVTPSVRLPNFANPPKRFPTLPVASVTTAGISSPTTKSSDTSARPSSSTVNLRNARLPSSSADLPQSSSLPASGDALKSPPPSSLREAGSRASAISSSAAAGVVDIMGFLKGQYMRGLKGNRPAA